MDLIIERAKARELQEIKEIYDLYPEIKIVISGSSLLQILNADADLSRRCVRYSLRGLSFREYLCFYKGINIRKYSIAPIIFCDIA